MIDIDDDDLGYKDANSLPMTRELLALVVSQPVLWTPQEPTLYNSRVLGVYNRFSGSTHSWSPTLSLVNLLCLAS